MCGLPSRCPGARPLTTGCPSSRRTAAGSHSSPTRGPRSRARSTSRSTYTTYPTDPNTHFAPITSATGQIELGAFGKYGKSDLDREWTLERREVPHGDQVARVGRRALRQGSAAADVARTRCANAAGGSTWTTTIRTTPRRTAGRSGCGSSSPTTTRAGWWSARRSSTRPPRSRSLCPATPSWWSTRSGCTTVASTTAPHTRYAMICDVRERPRPRALDRQPAAEPPRPDAPPDLGRSAGERLGCEPRRGGASPAAVAVCLRRLVGRCDQSCDDGQTCSEISGSFSSPRSSKRVSTWPTATSPSTTRAPADAEYLAKLGLSPYGAEHPGAGADHRDRLVAQHVCARPAARASRRHSSAGREPRSCTRA